MATTELKCNTWHDILIKEGFDARTAKSLIGFVSWNKGDEFAYMGREITDVLSGYEGKVFVRDAISGIYGDRALLFYDSDISKETAVKMFEAIMNYEQNKVYSPNEFVKSLE